ncbi:MAG: sigma-70 family RNA polymerase sigma factor, partial [Verrucomicrobiae bacterium]|nr:sigma-70 family RNA polymerase sigma factor [Verrucomicrobiae bacterium]
MAMNGIELLREYRESRSESAFSTLVRRYSGLVYSAARRRVGSGALAEEVTQSVFLQLAQTPPRVASDAALSGWLHRTTLHLSVDLWRSETRRLAREKTAALTLPMSDSSPASPESESLWADIAPILDEA